MSFYANRNGSNSNNCSDNSDIKIGNLTSLITTNKTNLVGAINENKSQLTEITNQVGSGGAIINDATPSAMTVYSSNKINSKFKDISINIRDFGGVGDGTFDNTTAVQNAFTALIATDGGILDFPSGSYVLQPISIPTSVILRGMGQANTSLKLKNNSNADFLTFDQASYSGVKDMSINGNKSYNSIGSGITLKNSKNASKDNSRNLDIQNLLITNCKENGIKVVDSDVWIFQLRHIKVDNCDGYAVWNASTDNAFAFIDAWNCKKGAYYECGCNNRWTCGKIYECGSDNHNTGAITLKDAERIIMSDFDIQDNYGHGIFN